MTEGYRKGQRAMVAYTGLWITLPELSELLRKTFGGFKQDVNTLQKIGQFLKRPEYQFENKRTHQGMIYKIKLR